MNKQKTYLETLGLVLASIVIYLSAVGELNLEVYVSFFIVGYFVVTAIFRPKKRWFDIASIAFFIVFCYIIFWKIVTMSS